ncbi:MAG: hypothetical protein CMP47_15345 [Rickettsiales bacterium]|nr:hypothetical protein [Rickettsiales bacterium]
MGDWSDLGNANFVVCKYFAEPTMLDSLGERYPQVTASIISLHRLLDNAHQPNVLATVPGLISSSLTKFDL